MPQGWIIDCNWQNIIEGLQRPRRDHFRLAEGLPDVAQHSSREQIASGVSRIWASRELVSDTGPS
jgi:hypothetical protein